MAKNQNPKNADLNVADLQSAETPQEGTLTKQANDAANRPEFDNIKWLKANDVTNYLSPETASSKYDAEREVKIQEGLKFLETIKIGDSKINPLLIQLGKWWENKNARAAIKKMIDAEAEKEGYHSVTYLQDILGKQVEGFKELLSGIERISYAKTYFKPRKDVVAKPITTPVNIDGTIYLVPVAELNQAKATYKDNRDELVKYLISISKVEDNKVEEI